MKFDRTTPACAGQTSCFPAESGKAGDYPRVCGADLGVRPLHVDAKGLPPRVRGRHVPGPACVQAAGTTPACAGQTLCVHRSTGL